GQDAVAEVEDMAGAAGGLVENRADAPANLGEAGEQRDRIEVALHADAVAEAGPRLAKVDAPVQSDDVAAGLAHQLQQVAGHGAEMNYRHTRAQRRNDGRGMRQDVAAIIVGSEDADPTVEELHEVGAGRD